MRYARRPPAVVAAGTLRTLDARRLFKQLGPYGLMARLEGLVSRRRRRGRHCRRAADAVERVYRRSRVEKLGVRPGQRVAVIGVTDGDLPGELAALTADVTIGEPQLAPDLVFLAAESPADLARLPGLRQRLRADGAIWVISRKGRGAALRDVEVMAAARDAGLVDNKVVGFSPTHTALRLVVHRARR